jgi:hypothetical protein
MSEPPRRPFVLDEGLSILGQTPPTVDALLRGLPETWVHVNEGGTSWSPFEVVGHLILADRTNWMPRMSIILEHGESRMFEEFKRDPKFARPEEPTLAGLLDEFATVRQDSLRALAGLRDADLERRGQHPALGRVTLRQLLSAWVVHDLDHLMQIARVLARQYTDEVGPWREYLRIVRDAPL